MRLQARHGRSWIATRMHRIHVLMPMPIPMPMRVSSRSVSMHARVAMRTTNVRFFSLSSHRLAQPHRPAHTRWSRAEPDTYFAAHGFRMQRLHAAVDDDRDGSSSCSTLVYKLTPAVAATFDHDCARDDDGKGDSAQRVPHEHRTAVIYLHGSADYFFQHAHAQTWLDRGVCFFALDLPNYGRSIRTHHRDDDDVDDGDNVDGRPPHCSHFHSIADFDAHLDALVHRLRVREPFDTVLLYGHSLGGLIATHYAHRVNVLTEDGANSPTINGLILNAPFFALRHSYPPLVYRALHTLVCVAGRVMPRAVAPRDMRETQHAEEPASRADSSVWYGRSLHVGARGEWTFDTRLKPLRRPRLSLAWVRACLVAQDRVQRGRMRLDVPALVLLSARSGGGSWWNESYTCTDAVLDVDRVRDVAQRIAQQGCSECGSSSSSSGGGSNGVVVQRTHNVTLASIDGAMHDVFLSRRSVRDVAHHVLFSWLHGCGFVQRSEASAAAAPSPSSSSVASSPSSS